MISLPMRLDYPLLEINPVFPGLGDIIIIMIIIIVIIFIIIIIIIVIITIITGNFMAIQLLLLFSSIIFLNLMKLIMVNEC